VRRTSHDLRCFCARSPMLAKYGVDGDGKLYVHVKVYKQRRVYSESFITGGTVKLLCRECLRWHRVVIRDTSTVMLLEDKVPVEISSGAMPA